MNARFKVTRRSFLKASMAATAALAVGSASAEDKTQSVRLGMIGMGGRGGSLLGTLLQFPEADVRAVCDLLPDRAQSAAQRIEQHTGRHPEVYAGSELAWERLVGRADLDAVIIATPWEWHTCLRGPPDSATCWWACSRLSWRSPMRGDRARMGM